MGTTLIPPDRQQLTPPQLVAQRRRHLQKAERIRLGRATLLRRIRALPPDQSCAMAADAVDDVPEVLATMTALDFLANVRRVGDTTAERLLRAAKIGLTVTMGALTLRQRTALATILRLRAEGIAPVAPSRWYEIVRSVDEL